MAQMDPYFCRFVHRSRSQIPPPTFVLKMDSDPHSSKDGGISKLESGEKNVPTSSNGRLVYVRRRPEVVDIARNQPKEPSTAPQGPMSWEERYHNLQMLLNKLDDDSDQTHHLQMLWSLSSAQLSNHAVELEKRSIQFSLEEAREMQRVAALNVLGKSLNSLKSTSNDGEF